VDVIALIFGMLVGAWACYRLLRRRVQGRVESLFDDWRRAEQEAVRAEAARRSEAVLRGRITEQLAPLLGAFPFHLADARFIGSPIDFVVFDGLSEVDSGTAGELRSITFVDVKTGGAGLTTIQRRTKSCLEEGRASCLVVAADR